jgi:hypothetical protein
MQRLVRPRPRKVIRGFVPAQAEIAESDQVAGVGASWFYGVQSPCKEEGVLVEAVVEVVMYELPQLAGDPRRRHGAWVGVSRVLQKVEYPLAVAGRRLFMVRSACRLSRRLHPQRARIRTEEWRAQVGQS